LSLMSFGDKAIVIMPSDLAYGASGAGGVIPPNATLVFEMEMTETKAEPK
jgi:peptidyl-prolyl cis-trans isomerase A (cyclophilin A)